MSLDGWGTFEDAVRAAGLEDHLAMLRALVRPCILLRARAPKASDLAPGATRLGGCPDLPKGLAWPRGPGGRPLSFVAQVRLESMQELDDEQRLPAFGLLSFFASQPDSGVVLHHVDADAVEPVPFPEDGEQMERFEPCGLLGERALSLPPPTHLLPLQSDARDRYVDAVWLPHRTAIGATGPVHQMLGYEGDDTDGHQDADTELLLAVASDGLSHMEWGDHGSLYFFVDATELGARRFTGVRVVSSL